MTSAGAVSRRRYGGLDVFEVASEGAELEVVLLHGYGAPGADLVALAAETPARRRCRWLFPAGPQALEADPAGFARAWFPIDEGRLLQAQLGGAAADFAEEDPPEFSAARDALCRLLDDAAVEPRRLVIGGFSQGGMVACDLALEARRPAALAIFSGNLIAGARWGRAAPERAGLPFFQSHGRADPILAFRGALRLETLLREAGLRGSLYAFDGGHAIPPEVLAAFGAFLDSVALS